MNIPFIIIKFIPLIAFIIIFLNIIIIIAIAELSKQLEKIIKLLKKK